MSELPTLNPVFHQPVRTRLAVLLNTQEQTFSGLKTALNVTDGNLDAHLRKLSSAGYLHSRMVRIPRPHTVYKLSHSGQKAFQAYLKSLRVLISKSK